MVVTANDSFLEENVTLAENEHEELTSACFGEYFPFLHVTNCRETNLFDSSQLNLQVLPLQLAITSSVNLSSERTSPHGVDV